MQISHLISYTKNTYIRGFGQEKQKVSDLIRT